MNTLPKFGSIEARNAVRRVVVEKARPMAKLMGHGQIGFGFICLGLKWDAKCAPAPNKWEIFCGGEFFTDMSVGVGASKHL